MGGRYPSKEDKKGSGNHGHIDASSERRFSGGILKSDLRARTASDVSIDVRHEDPSSPCPSDRLSVTWADGERSVCSDISVNFRTKQDDFSSKNPSIATLLPASLPVSPGLVSSADASVQPDNDLDLNLDSNVSLILRRSASTRAGKKKKTAFIKTSSTELYTLDQLLRTAVEEDSTETENQAKVYREALAGLKNEVWPINRKLHLARSAKEYLEKHKGLMEERLAQSTSKKDVFLRYFILCRRALFSIILAAYNWVTSIEIWQGRIKQIESHFGSAVTSYFTFTRWVIGLNAVIAILLAAFVAIPEVLTGDWDNSGERKEILSEEKISAYDLKVMWNFEGILKYSPIFYGFYGNKEYTDSGYRLPLAYILTSMCVYGYSFIAILRKMAANSRMSKLGDTGENAFTLKLFASWDYTIGDSEAALNKVASINIGFREMLLEAREADKEVKSLKISARRVLAHILVLCLLVGSAYAVILLVERSRHVTDTSSWFSQNELTIVLSSISIVFPNLFEMVGLLECHHPRKQLQYQLARIMVLNLLNIYTLIFALFGKVNDMSDELICIKEELESSNRMVSTTESSLPESSSNAPLFLSSTILGMATMTPTLSTVLHNVTSRLNDTLPEFENGCRLVMTPCEFINQIKSYSVAEDSAIFSNVTESTGWITTRFDSKSLNSSESRSINNHTDTIGNSSLFTTQEILRNDTDPSVWITTIFDSKSLNNSESRSINNRTDTIGNFSLFTTQEIPRNGTEPSIWITSRFDSKSLNNSESSAITNQSDSTGNSSLLTSLEPESAHQNDSGATYWNDFWQNFSFTRPKASIQYTTSEGQSIMAGDLLKNVSENFVLSSAVSLDKRKLKDGYINTSQFEIELNETSKSFDSEILFSTVKPSSNISKPPYYGSAPVLDDGKNLSSLSELYGNNLNSFFTGDLSVTPTKVQENNFTFSNSSEVPQPLFESLPKFNKIFAVLPVIVAPFKALWPLEFSSENQNLSNSINPDNNTLISRSKREVHLKIQNISQNDFGDIQSTVNYTKGLVDEFESNFTFDKYLESPGKYFDSPNQNDFNFGTFDKIYILENSSLSDNPDRKEILYKNQSEFYDALNEEFKISFIANDTKQRNDTKKNGYLSYAPRVIFDDYGENLLTKNDSFNNSYSQIQLNSTAYNNLNIEINSQVQNLSDKILSKFNVTWNTSEVSNKTSFENDNSTIEHLLEELSKLNFNTIMKDVENTTEKNGSFPTDDYEPFMPKIPSFRTLNMSENLPNFKTLNMSENLPNFKTLNMSENLPFPNVSSVNFTRMEELPLNFTNNYTSDLDSHKPEMNSSLESIGDYVNYDNYFAYISEISNQDKSNCSVIRKVCKGSMTNDYNYTDNSSVLHFMNPSISENEIFPPITAAQPNISSVTPPTSHNFPSRNITLSPHLEHWVKFLPLSNRTRLRRLCWETMFGQEIIKLLVMDLVLTVSAVVLTDFVRAVIVRSLNFWCCWDMEKQFPGYADFKIAEHILHLVNNQGLVWMGMFFSPGLPAINLVKLLVLFYVRCWAVVTSNVPPETVFKASDNNNFYLALLLIMLFLCTLPVGYAVVWLTPSWHCGPFSTYKKIYQQATETLISSLPTAFAPIIDYISSPGIVIPAGLLLVLIIYYLVSLTGALRETIQDLKDQLRQERSSEKQRALAAKSGDQNESSNTWSKVILQMTPMFQQKQNRNKPVGTDDKIPLLSESQNVTSSQGRITVHPDVHDVPSLSKGSPLDINYEKTKCDQPEPFPVQLTRREITAKLLDEAQFSDDSLSHIVSIDSPRTPKEFKNKILEKFRPQSEGALKSPILRANKLARKDFHSKRNTVDEARTSKPFKTSNSGSLNDKTSSSPRDTGTETAKILEKEGLVEHKTFHKSEENCRKPFNDTPAPTEKLAFQFPPRSTDQTQQVKPSLTSGRRHMRSKSSCGLRDTTLTYAQKLNTFVEQKSKESEEEMQTVPFIKISKEDSVEKSLQSKLERQSEISDELSVIPSIDGTNQDLRINGTHFSEEPQSNRTFEDENQNGQFSILPEGLEREASVICANKGKGERDQGEKGDVEQGDSETNEKELNSERRKYYLKDIKASRSVEVRTPNYATISRSDSFPKYREKKPPHLVLDFTHEEPSNEPSTVSNIIDDDCKYFVHSDLVYDVTDIDSCYLDIKEAEKTVEESVFENSEVLNNE